MRKLEAVFAVLISTMAISFAWMFGQTQPSGTELLIGAHLSLTIVNFYFLEISSLEINGFFCYFQESLCQSSAQEQ